MSFKFVIEAFNRDFVDKKKSSLCFTPANKTRGMAFVRKCADRSKLALVI